MNDMRYTLFELETIRREYPLGGTAAVQKVLRRSQDSIRHTAKKLGVKYELRYAGNQTDFSSLTNPRTPQDAYILGLLWADGTVRRHKRGNLVSLTLVEDDFRDVAHLFAAWRHSRIEYTDHPTWQIQARVSLSHKTLVIFLLNHDYGCKSKGSPDKILSIIPEGIRHYFYRGWFDGDGFNNCLRKASCGCCIAGSSEQDWTALTYLATNLGFPYRIDFNRGKKGSGSSFVILSRVGTRRFFEYIYDGVEIGLRRKYKNWIEYDTLNICEEYTHWRKPHLMRDKGWCEIEYVQAQRSYADLARTCGVSTSAVWYWLRKHGLIEQKIP